MRYLVESGHREHCLATQATRDGMMSDMKHPARASIMEIQGAI